MTASTAIRTFSLIALCSLLVATSCFLPRAESSNSHHSPGSGSSSAEQQQHKALVKKSPSSLSDWIRSYKEPKLSSDEQQQQPAEQAQKSAAPQEEEEEEELTCTIKVQKVEKHTGKCVRLRGGMGACQTKTYLDPMNADCMFVE